MTALRRSLADFICQGIKHKAGINLKKKKKKSRCSVLLTLNVLRHLPQTPSPPTASTSCGERVVEKSEHCDIYGEPGCYDRGRKVPVLLILHRVHRKAKVAASTTCQFSSASHTELPLRSTYSNV